MTYILDQRWSAGAGTQWSLRDHRKWTKVGEDETHNHDFLFVLCMAEATRLEMELSRLRHNTSIRTYVHVGPLEEQKWDWMLLASKTMRQTDGQGPSSDQWRQVRRCWMNLADSSLRTVSRRVRVESLLCAGPDVSFPPKEDPPRLIADIMSDAHGVVRTLDNAQKKGYMTDTTRPIFGQFVPSALGDLLTEAFSCPMDVDEAEQNDVQSLWHAIDVMPSGGQAARRCQRAIQRLLAIISPPDKAKVNAKQTRSATAAGDTSSQAQEHQDAAMTMAGLAGHNLDGTSEGDTVQMDALREDLKIVWKGLQTGKEARRAKTKDLMGIFAELF